jgi:hypothetical protein
MRSSYHFTLIYVVRTGSPQIPLELKHKKIPSLISALSACGLVLYSSSPFQRCAQLFLEPNIRREVTSWLGWPYGSPSLMVVRLFLMSPTTQETNSSPTLLGDVVIVGIVSSVAWLSLSTSSSRAVAVEFDVVDVVVVSLLPTSLLHILRTSSHRPTRHASQRRRVYTH